MIAGLSSAVKSIKKDPIFDQIFFMVWVTGVEPPDASLWDFFSLDGARSKNPHAQRVITSLLPPPAALGSTSLEPDGVLR